MKFLEIVKEIRLKLPDDLKQAKWVKDERQRILQEAQKEGNDIIKNAESRISSLVDEHEITKKAYEQANDMITNAKQNSRGD
jgi:F0F1-type ATP synthase membrane subunit b/b'